MKFITFMTSNRGRMMRIAAGLVLMIVGLFVIRDTAGTILAVAALVPIAGGVFDFCLAGLVLGYPLKGAEARRQIANSAARV
jgi:hypothetical protein